MCDRGSSSSGVTSLAASFEHFSSNESSEELATVGMSLFADLSRLSRARRSTASASRLSASETSGQG